LDGYLRAEKADVAHPNAAWAHETGKGLLFFAKRAEDKAAPTGILNLVGSSHLPVFVSIIIDLVLQAEITDVTKEGFNEFSFRLNGHKHVFQATSAAECSSWTATIETKATEAKALKEGLVSSDGYKKHIEHYSVLFPDMIVTCTPQETNRLMQI
jgi:Pleckstrin homology domain